MTQVQPQVAAATQRPGGGAAGLPQVQGFCQTHGITPHLAELLHAVSDSFDLSAPPQLSLGTDPETDEQWLEIGVSVRGEPDAILGALDHFMDRWLAIAPPGVRDRVRLVYDVA